MATATEEGSLHRGGDDIETSGIPPNQDAYREADSFGSSNSKELAMVDPQNPRTWSIGKKLRISLFAIMAFFVV